jgi:hypothetical protein
MELDDFDLTLIAELDKNGRASYAQLTRSLGSAVTPNILHLENQTRPLVKIRRQQVVLLAFPGGVNTSYIF